MTSGFEHVEINAQHSKAVLSIDKKIYSKSAVLRACYWFSRELWFDLQEKEDCFLMTAGVLVTSPTLSHPTVKKIEEWLPQILNALADSQLRVEIQAETASVRELIIAKAFAESGVLEDAPPGTFTDLVESKNLVKLTTTTLK
jgi:His-Xaa-Ser system protein HxsD